VNLSNAGSISTTGLEQVWKQRGSWGEMLKNTTVRFAYIKFVSNYPFFQQWKIPIGLILTETFHQMLITPHQKRYRLHVIFIVRTVFSQDDGQR